MTVSLARHRHAGLAAVLLLALGLRILNLVDVADSPFFTRPVVDGKAYDRWAQAIVRGDAPREPFYQDPLYPYALAASYRVFGHSFWPVYVGQILLGAGIVLLVFDLGRMLFGYRAGLVGALIAAVYRPLLFYEVQIDKTILAVFLATWLLWTILKTMSRRWHWGWSLVVGMSLGLATLVRANIGLFVPLVAILFLLGPLGYRTESQRTRGRSWLQVLRLGGNKSTWPVLAFLAGVVVTVGPVSIRNSLLAREFVLTTTQAGQNLYIGNSPYNTTGQYQAPTWVRPNPDFEQTDFREYAAGQAGRRLGYNATSSFFARRALDWAIGHPQAFWRLLGRKALLYFNDFEVPDNQDIYFFARYSWVLRLPLLSFGMVFGLGFAGMVFFLRPGRRAYEPGLSHMRWLVLVFFVGYALSVIVFFVFSRYRLPAVPALMPFAGAMSVWFFDAARRRYRASWFELGYAILLVVGSWSLTGLPIRHKGKSEAAQCLVNLATEFIHEGDTSEAMKAFDEALRVQPEYGEALRNLGTIAYNRGRYDQAFNLLRRAAQADFGNPATHDLLGKIFERQKQYALACDEYRKAVSLAPGRVEYRFDLAGVLVKLDSPLPALAHYDTLLRLAPNHPGILHNRAVVLHSLGRDAEARAQVEAALRLGMQPTPFSRLLGASEPDTQGLGK